MFTVPLAEEKLICWAPWIGSTNLANLVKLVLDQQDLPAKVVLAISHRLLRSAVLTKYTARYIS